MICHYNNSACNQNGYCTCQGELSPEFQKDVGGGMGIIVAAVLILLVSFLFPGIKILMAQKKFSGVNKTIFYPDGTRRNIFDVPELAGLMWLMLSPVFGLIPAFTRYFIDHLPPVGHPTLQAQAGSAFFQTFVFTFAIGFALLAFVIKNWRVFLDFFKNKTKLFEGQNLTAMVTMGILISMLMISASLTGYRFTQLLNAYAHPVVQRR